MELGFETIGNATLICYDRTPILVTDPGSSEAPTLAVGAYPMKFRKSRSMRSRDENMYGFRMVTPII